MFNKPIFEFFETADSEGQTIIYFRLGEREGKREREREREREKYRYFTCSR
jgi:hypothetical protein